MRTTGWIWVAALVAAWGCGSSKDDGEARGAPAAGEGEAPVAAPATPRFEAETPVLADIPATLLPRDTLLVVAAVGPGPLVEALELDAILSAGAEALAVVELSPGIPLSGLTPAGMAAAGLDPRRPIGIAWLGGDGGGWVAFAAVADEEVLDAALPVARDRRGKQAGGGRALRDSSAVAIVRGGHLWIASDAATADRLVRVEPPASLAAEPALARAIEALAYGRMAAGWANVPAIAARERERLERASAAVLAERTRAERGLERLRRQRRPPEDRIASAERHLESFARRVEFLEEGGAALAAALGPMSGLAVGLGVDGSDLLVRAALVPVAEASVEPDRLPELVGWILGGRDDRARWQQTFALGDTARTSIESAPAARFVTGAGVPVRAELFRRAWRPAPGASRDLMLQAAQDVGAFGVFAHSPELTAKREARTAVLA